MTDAAHNTRDHETWWKNASSHFLRTKEEIEHPVRPALQQIAADAGCKSVLEVGCATAIDCPAYLARGMSYTGVDMTPNLLARAKELNPQGTFLHGNATQLPVGDRSYDFAFCKDLLEHLQPSDMEKVVREIWRASKTAIAIALFMPLKDKEDVEIRRRHFPRRLWDKTFFYNNTYSRGAFKALLGSLGGTVTEHQPDTLFSVRRA
jgi:SAM-dependent methyltransferase